MQLIPGRLSTGLVRQNALFQAIFFLLLHHSLSWAPPTYSSSCLQVAANPEKVDLKLDGSFQTEGLHQSPVWDKWGLFSTVTLAELLESMIT